MMTGKISQTRLDRLFNQNERDVKNGSSLCKIQINWEEFNLAKNVTCHRISYNVDLSDLMKRYKMYKWEIECFIEKCDEL